jgi:hypothetical protein
MAVIPATSATIIITITTTIIAVADLTAVGTAVAADLTAVSTATTASKLHKHKNN